MAENENSAAKLGVPSVNEAELQQSLKEYQIPSSLHGGIIRWICQGIPPGSFLRRIIENDTAAALQWADNENIRHVEKLVSWFIHEAPAECWGSAGNIVAWMASKRTKRFDKAQTEDKLSGKTGS